MTQLGGVSRILLNLQCLLVFLLLGYGALTVKGILGIRGTDDNLTTLIKPVHRLMAAH